MYWTLSKGILNYSSPAYRQWLLANEEALHNLWNPSYWKSQMTQEEKEMRRHPNRSMDWIPNRLTKMRDRVKEEQMTWILGEDGWSNKWNYDGPCYRCGVEIDRLRQYQSQLMQRYEILRKDQFDDVWEMTEDDHQKILQQVLAELADSGEYTIQEIERSIIRHPELRSYTMMSSIYGFCPECYENWVEPQLGWVD